MIINIPKDKNIFITGGAGFIGATLVGRLIESNKVTVFDNLSRNSLKYRKFNNHPNLTKIEGDILDTESLSSAMQGADYIIHCAGIAGIDTVIKRPTLTMNVNMVGSANVLEAASKLPNCKRVICLSTSEVFGKHALDSSEKDDTIIGAVGEPRWTYAVSKLAEEHLTIAYYKEMGLPTVVLRPFNIYGPGQVGEGALSIFIQNALKNKEICIHGDGTQIRAWTYVDDMINAILLSMTDPRAVGESFNIGNRQSIETILRLAHTVRRVLNSKSEITFTKRDFADVEIRIPSIIKAENLLDWEATIDLETGISKTAEYYSNALIKLA